MCTNVHGFEARTNARLGAGDWLVAEADESDGTFVKLPADIAIVTNIDPEHLDHYGDFDGVRAAFRQFVENVPFYGFAVMCIDHPEVQAMVGRIEDRRIITYGQNPQADVAYNVRFTAPEFTSLCPMTGQPDFAHLVIDYVPGEWLVESKSLKLFLGSFRNHGAFHEDCTVSIARRLVEFLEPQWLRIGGYWYPRGGIPIDVFYQTGPMPEGVWIPDQGVPPYRGRG